MLLANSLPPLPRFNLDNVIAVDAGLPVLARLALSGHGASPRESLEKMLAPLYPDRRGCAMSLITLANEGQIAISKRGHCRITEAGRKRVQGRLGNLLACNWTDVTVPRLAALALGIAVHTNAAQQYLVRKGNLECAALALLYNIDEPGAMPSRSEVHSALLRVFVSSRLPECESAFTEISMRNTSRDPIGRAVLLGAAGLQRGTHRDAESAILRKAFGLRPDNKGGSIADALIRHAIGKGMPRGVTPVREVRQEKPVLATFAASVRDLARTLRTDPFAGRVAIAQVYDAGLSRKLDFGTLEEFKGRVAEAGRAGLLDLERYDIAGPMDNALRDRSRTVFGRDERHFIVNEWI